MGHIRYSTSVSRSNRESLARTEAQFQKTDSQQEASESLHLPFLPEIVMATDMLYPPGVIIERGDLPAVRLSEKSSSLSVRSAKPDNTAAPGPRASLGSGLDDSISNSDVLIIPCQLAS